MPVYVVNNLKITDEAEYTRYLFGFMAVLQKFNGEVLVAQEDPEVFEGRWPFDKTIILSFPTRADFESWSSSAEYQAIARYRQAGAQSNIALIDVRQRQPTLPPTGASHPRAKQTTGARRTRRAVVR